MGGAFEAALLLGSAFLAGIINSVAGGGTLLTFPALLRFGQLTAVLANTTSTVALVPGSIGGAWGFRKELVGAGPWLSLLLGPSLVGGVIGSLLVTR
ncbi:MAG: TSUP family transporter, partial [Gemmataceae bacterium]